jgi:hypothetical protein
VIGFLTDLPVLQYVDVINRKKLHCWYLSGPCGVFCVLLFGRRRISVAASGLIVNVWPRDTVV